MSCNSCHALSGGMIAHPATQLYWMEDRTTTPGTKLHAAIPQVHHRERLDLYPPAIVLRDWDMEDFICQ